MILKGRRFPVEVLTPDEVRNLIDANRGGTAGIRNRALLVLLYRSGLRISEALDLRPKDLDKEAGTVRVLHGKGNKARTVGMDKQAFEQVDKWLQLRAQKHGDEAPIFCTRNGGKIDVTYIRQLFPRLGRHAGIKKRVHAHGLRHTLAAEMRAEGCDIGIISKQLGHSSIATTANYLDHIAPAAVVGYMGTREW